MLKLSLDNKITSIINVEDVRRHSSLLGLYHVQQQTADIYIVEFLHMNFQEYLCLNYFVYCKLSIIVHLKIPRGIGLVVSASLIKWHLTHRTHRGVYSSLKSV